MCKTCLREEMVKSDGSALAPATAPAFCLSRFFRIGSGSFTYASEAAAAHGMQQIEVPVVTLNEIVRTSSAPFPEMVKIDAEGFDLKVIAGASELIGRTDIFFLETAIWPQGFQNTLAKTIATMS
jgi:hypothetical protein